jgi:tRNA nucleotidyltransferase (CCA-adding enzyme)
MAAQEPDRVSGAAPARDPVSFLREHAPWLFAPALRTCIVGSHALGIACRRDGVPGPAPRDLDLAWSLAVASGRPLLEQHGVFVPTTDGNLARGTLAMKLGDQRIEITTFRNGAPDLADRQRIDADLAARDMTIGALAFEVATSELHDPTGGMADFKAGRIVPVGDVADRVREHPVRWLRYFRKAHEWGFALDRSVRRLRLPPTVLDEVPREAVAAELRAALLHCASPGRFFLELHEVGLLASLAPELDLQFDGRPAGPQRWHPEVSQALHLVLALEWAAANSRHLDFHDRLRLMVAVLCHDLGKGYTKTADLPGHPGHERRGLPALEQLLDRFPGLVDQRGRAVARAVCELHVEIRRLRELRPGTIARLYRRHFRPRDFPVDLFALAVAADSAGRLGHADEGRAVATRVAADVSWLRHSCEQVDATALRARFPKLDDFRQALHEAQSRAIDRRELAREDGTMDAASQAGT